MSFPFKTLTELLSPVPGSEGLLQTVFFNISRLAKVPFDIGFVKMLFSGSGIIFDTFLSMHENSFLYGISKGTNNIFLRSGFILANALPSVIKAVFKNKDDKEKGSSEKIIETVDSHRGKGNETEELIKNVSMLLRQQNENEQADIAEKNLKRIDEGLDRVIYLS